MPTGKIESQKHIILTKKGTEVQKKAIITKNSVDLKYFAVGDGGENTFSLPVLDPNKERLYNEIVRVPIISIQALEGLDSGKFLITAYIPKNEVGGFYLKEFGVFSPDNEMIFFGHLDNYYKYPTTSERSIPIVIQAEVPWGNTVGTIDNPSTGNCVVDSNGNVTNKNGETIGSVNPLTVDNKGTIKDKSGIIIGSTNEVNVDESGTVTNNNNEVLGSTNKITVDTTTGIVFDKNKDVIGSINPLIVDAKGAVTDLSGAVIGSTNKLTVDTNTGNVLDRSGAIIGSTNDITNKLTVDSKGNIFDSKRNIIGSTNPIVINPKGIATKNDEVIGSIIKIIVDDKGIAIKSGEVIGSTNPLTIDTKGVVTSKSGSIVGSTNPITINDKGTATDSKGTIVGSIVQLIVDTSTGIVTDTKGSIIGTTGTIDSGGNPNTGSGSFSPSGGSNVTVPGINLPLVPEYTYVTKDQLMQEEDALTSRQISKPYLFFMSQVVK